MMRHPVLLIFVNAMILIVVFALLTQSLVIVQRIAKADFIMGTVEVQRGGKGDWKPLAKGGLIKTGDTVRSGKSGVAEFKWADGTRWKIMPATEITVKKSTYNMVKKTDQSQLKITTGQVFIRIMKSLKPASKFEVETPTAVAAVRGTIFSVQVVNGKTSVAVWKGAVKVSSKSGNANLEKMIASGQMAASNGAGDVHEESAATSASDFKKQASIVLPQLEVEMKPLQDKRILISGTTEAGNSVQVNGKNARVLGNGTFMFRAKAGSAGVWKVVATDKHGASASRVLQAAPAASTRAPGAPLCASVG